MFKNLIVYRIHAGWAASVEKVAANMARRAFTECGATQEKSIGWAPPRGEPFGPLIENIGGQWLMKLMVETKSVPSSVIKRKAQQRAEEIEQTTGREIKHKAMKDLKEETRLALLPVAFAKQSSTLVWIDPEKRLMVVDSSSQAKADDVVECLLKSVNGIELSLLQTETSITILMSAWLTSREAPARFSIDRECELKATDDSKAVVRYSKHPLDIAEIGQHIINGKVPTKLALTWSDRIAFLLTDALQIKKLQFLDGIFDESLDKEERFDADVAIVTRELTHLIPDLFDALGGELQS